MEHTEEKVQAHVEEHKRPNYFLVFLALAALTLAEVGVTFLNIPQIPILAALASAKIVLVAMFYMHLKTDSKWFTYIFLVPIPFVVLIIASLLVY
ncbi:MAG TPA: cytochrome C oxidase subunit IV family protein [Aggregatilineales bacterium]|jgi:caa(3)-type oxidase subunit IV|nr:cytochrome C oxidase subunit IV family protein [Chloroflexota bacterium]HOA24622.1 cytochrome C oxidase subunit IV family protein [Aggregatilineales bacterium]HPV08278.1 cytochrome C oxidase subunit IV family protein [Aggregatilineales bacterium]HQA67794.1 cytochrome C oxidase subunit IV family protein [Aggregatilineales bacterium]HQE18713.1 cytochrome C oxidase subunit IV family protein [Aggregatilineales bacterium]